MLNQINNEGYEAIHTVGHDRLYALLYLFISNMQFRASDCMRFMYYDFIVKTSLAIDHQYDEFYVFARCCNNSR